MLKLMLFYPPVEDSSGASIFSVSSGGAAALSQKMCLEICAVWLQVFDGETNILEQCVRLTIFQE